MTKSSTSNAHGNLLKKVPERYQEAACKWVATMQNGSQPYGRAISFDCIRLYLNAMNKIWHLLEADYSDLYEATVQAIEAHKPEQFSSRKHCKEAAISLAKFLIRQEFRDSNNILERLRSIKIKRHKDIRRPTFREKELNLLLEANQRLKTNQASKNLNEILLKFAFYTGLRVSEICNLNFGDVFLDEGRILVVNGKGGKNRWVAINKALKEDLRNYIENVRGEN